MANSKIAKLLREKTRLKRQNKMKEVIEMCNALGLEFFELGKYEEALDEHKEALELSEMEHDMISKAISHRYIGCVHSSMADYKAALREHNIYLDLSIQCKSQIEQQRAYVTIGNTHLDFVYLHKGTKKGQIALKKAEESFILALKLCEGLRVNLAKVDYVEMKCRCLLNLGIVYDTDDNEPLGVDYYNQAIKFAEEHALYDELYIGLTNIMEFYKKLRKFDLALVKANRLVACSRKLREKKIKERDSMVMKAKVLLCMSNFVAAKQALIKAYKMKFLFEGEDDLDHMHIEKLLKKVVRICNIVEDVKLMGKHDPCMLYKLYEKLGDEAANVGSCDFALESYKNMETCAKALKMKGAELIDVCNSLWFTYKDLDVHCICLQYLEKEICYTSKDDNSRLSVLYLSKATILGRANQEHDLIREAYDLAYHHAEQATNDEDDVVKIKILRYMLSWQKKEKKEEDASNTRKILQQLKTRRNNNNNNNNNNKRPDDSDVQNDDESDDDDVVPYMFEDFDVGDDEEDEDESDDVDLDREVDMCSDNDEDDNSRGRSRKKDLLSKVTKYGESLLQAACISGDLLKVKSYIKQGLPVNQRDNGGWLPLHDAAINGHVEIVEVLLQNAAWVNDRGGSGCEGFTPLHSACLNGHVDVIELLCRQGKADLLCKNDKGQLALDIFKEFCESEYATDEHHEYYKKFNQRTQEQREKILKPFNDQRQKFLQKNQNSFMRQQQQQRQQQKPQQQQKPPQQQQPNRQQQPTNVSKIMRPATDSRLQSRHPDKQLRDNNVIEDVTSSSSDDEDEDEDGATKRKPKKSKPQKSGGRDNDSCNLNDNDDASDERLYDPKVAVKAYRQAISNIKKPAALLSQTQSTNQSKPKLPAVVDKSEFVDDDWLVDDVNQKEDLVPPSSAVNKSSSKKLHSISKPAIVRKRKSSSFSSSSPSHLIPLPPPPSSSSYSRNNRDDVSDGDECKSKDDDDHSGRKNVRKKLKGNSTSIKGKDCNNNSNNNNINSVDNINASNNHVHNINNHVVNDLHNNINTDDNTNDFKHINKDDTLNNSKYSSSNRNYNNKNNFDTGNNSNNNKSSSSIISQIWVKVKIEDRIVMVPIASGSNHTFMWLAEEASIRHYNNFCCKPRLQLWTADGILLSLQDNVAGMLCNNQQIFGEVVGWHDISVECRYEDACKALQTKSYSNIKSQLVECDQSNILNLVNRSIQFTQLQPIVRVLQSLDNLTHLFIQGNKIKNEGFRSLAVVLKYVPYLSSLDVSNNQLTYESLISLANCVSSTTNKKPLQCLQMLSLGNNPLTDASSQHLKICLSNLPMLSQLHINCCSLTNKFFNFSHSIFNDSSLELLDISENNLSQIQSSRLIQFFDFGRLESLFLPEVNLDFVECLKKHLLESQVNFDDLKIRIVVWTLDETKNGI
ncbi:hypothetical protein HELRODRAFT_193042 [Helobdella robusta]|uniref:Tonsoku-like protein n=1 Tax=Helobdella robusta TaxID=6412 RepID=T1FUK0_HELRO|nr:hypothetical protein HELRODRAFT_193042 [Helobdella robusta]ESN98309.1 hypothetical protein HELRODRAFT_193042 [Helobdella robusta]